MTTVPNKTRRQHYVWKKYLRAWAQDEKIHAYLKDQNKFINPNLMGIGQQRDFYHVSIMTDQEYEYTKALIKKITKNNSLVNELFYLNAYQNSNTLLKKARMKRSIDDGLIAALEADVFNLGEKLQTEFENSGDAYLEKLYEGDPSFFLDLDSRIEFSLYLSMQYMRTNNVRNGIIRNIGEVHREMDVINMWRILQITFAQNLAKSIAVDTLTKMTVYLSLEKGFLTSDQPAINLRQEVDQDGAAKFLELYYPVSPKIAVLLTPHDKYEVVSKHVSMQRVHELNQFQANNCLNQVYSNSCDIIKQYI